MQTVITTVGTSLFINYMDKETRKLNEFCPNADNYLFIDEEFGKYEKSLSDKYDDSDTSIKYISKTINNEWLTPARYNACAEIQSLVKIAEKEDLRVYLLATDTVLSVLACVLIKDWCSKWYTPYKINVIFDPNHSLHVIKGLQIFENEIFQTIGFSNLLVAIKHWNGMCKDKNRPILNISGGYKAITPILTIMGQLYGMPIAYIYENSDSLIEIKQSPLGVDWELLEKNSPVLRGAGPFALSDLKRAFEAGLIKKDEVNPPELTFMGTLLSDYLLEVLPFEKRLNGYMIEHKLFEYYLKNPYSDYTTIEHSYPLFPNDSENMDDADLWMTKEDGSSAVFVEIKPDNWSISEYRKEVAKSLVSAQKAGMANIKEFWLVLYGYSNLNSSKTWSELLTLGINDVKIKVKGVVVPDNTVDGKINRFSRHEFYRSKINEVTDIFEGITNPSD